MKKPYVVVFGCKSWIHANSTYPADFILENLKIQNNVSNHLAKWVKRTRFFNSCIYPKFVNQPIKEEELLIKLELLMNGMQLKIAGIKLCAALKSIFFDAISLMPTNLYDLEIITTIYYVLPSFNKKIYRGIVNKQDYVKCWDRNLYEFHVDILEMPVFALENWNPTHVNANENLLLNECYRFGYCIHDLAEMISKV